MAAVIFVEVLDRLGRVQRRQRFDHFPITIGRAYSNDVILVDRLVSPEHLTVRQTEEGLVIEDRDSVNGLFPQGSRRPVHSLALIPGTEIRIGHTRLRFCTPDQPVAPTVRRATGGIAALFSSNWAKVAAIAGAVVVLQTIDYLSTYARVEFSDVVGTVSLAVCVLFLWAGLWAIGSRLAVHEFHMTAHWTVASLAVVGSTLVGVAFEYLDFFFSDRAFIDLVEWAAWAGVLTGLLYAHLSVASAMAPARRLRISLGTVAMFVALLAVDHFGERDEFSPAPHFASELKPVGAGWIPKRSPAEFFAAMGSLEKRLDSRAEIEKNQAPPEASSAAP